MKNILTICALLVSTSVFAGGYGPSSSSIVAAGSVGGSVVSTAGGSQTSGFGLAGTSSGVGSEQFSKASANVRGGSIRTSQSSGGVTEGYSMTGSIGHGSAGSDYFGAAAGVSGAGGVVVVQPSQQNNHGRRD